MEFENHGDKSWAQELRGGIKNCITITSSFRDALLCCPRSDFGEGNSSIRNNGSLDSTDTVYHFGALRSVGQRVKEGAMVLIEVSTPDYQGGLNDHATMEIRKIRGHL